MSIKRLNDYQKSIIENFLNEKPGYLKKSSRYIAEYFSISLDEINISIIDDIKYSIYLKNKREKEKEIKKETDKKISTLVNKTKVTINKDETVLVIGDIHEPFTLEGYIEFCKETYDKFNCTKVVFIGDIIDNHFSSFHNTDPDGFGAGEELERAINKIQKWYKYFPSAIVIIGNHDRMAYRKAFAGGVSSKWIRDYDEVLGTPGWEFKESVVIDNVLYIHGESGTATTKAKNTSMSVVQGHLHSEGYVNFINNRIFAMQVGTGIDDTAYAFGYNKAGKESILSCGVVEKGKQPYLLKMI